LNRKALPVFFQALDKLFMEKIELSVGPFSFSFL
jgi:hypothetical protein